MLVDLKDVFTLFLLDGPWRQLSFSLPLSFCLSLSLFLITKHDIHGYFFFPLSWLQRGQLWAPLLARPGGGSDRRLALFTLVASRVIWLIMWLMGGLCGSPHTVSHNEDSFIFNTIECLSHSTLCGGDWLSLCACSWGALPLLPFQTGICSSSCPPAAGQGKSRLLSFLQPMNWWPRCEMGAEPVPPAPWWRHRLAVCYSNISQQDILRGSRAHVPQVCRCQDNNLLSTKEK